MITVASIGWGKYTACYILLVVLAGSILRIHEGVNLPAGAHNAATYPIVPVMWLLIAQHMTRTLAGASAVELGVGARAMSSLASSFLASSWSLNDS